MFPEDVNINILSFLGISPRRRCYARTRNKTICKKSVKNTNCNILCPLHDYYRFQKPLFHRFEEITYLANLTDINNRYLPKRPTILKCPPTPTIADWMAAH
jgi:hypothetical protein